MASQVCQMDSDDWGTSGLQSPLIGKTFQCGGRTLPYFVHPYNRTYANERAVEIPLARDFMLGLIADGANPSNHILEIGNVYPHYDWTSTHRVIDMGEKDVVHGVENVDLLEYQTHLRFRGILSISTIEHIGIDDRKDQPQRVDAAIAKIRSLLSPDGQALITVPMGYNHRLDYMILAGMVGGKTKFMKRTRSNRWEQIAQPVNTENIKYGSPYNNANVVAFVYMNGDAE